MASDGEYMKECSFSSLPRTTRGLPIGTSASPDGARFLYCCGNGIYIRSSKDPNDCELYTEHSHPTTVAKYSPSGFYIASGDQTGRIRIWDATQPTHLLKSEYHFISGAIRDISWSADSKRIAVVGEGQERFGHVFLFDTGTSNGSLSGQSRPMTSIDFRPLNPLKLVSASEDNSVAIFEGPPFKFKTLFHEHTRFVNCIRYNKDGSLFVSGGADGKVIIFDGLGESKVGELVDESCKGAAHTGSIFGLCWSPDCRSIVTASADKSVKIWNVSEKKLMKSIAIGSAIEDQQLSVVWLKDSILSFSLSGFINYIDSEKFSVNKILKGHNKAITSMALSSDKKFLITADFEGNIVRWSVNDGLCNRVNPTIHKSKISGLALSKDGTTLVSIAWDDKIAFTDLKNIDEVKTTSEKLTSQPSGIAVSNDLKKVAISCTKSIAVFIDRKLATNLNTKFEAACVAIHPNGLIVAVGGNESRVHVYDLAGNGTLSEKQVLQHQGAITSVSFSPNGKFLVATDIVRKVVPYDLESNFKVSSEKEWSYHSARINCSSWSEDSRYVATGGLDTNIIIWDIKRSGEHPIIIRAAHPTSQVNCVEWLSSNRIISAGQDSNINQWSLKLDN